MPVTQAVKVREYIVAYNSPERSVTLQINGDFAVMHA